MEITLTTPALLFPALSLLMLAYTNRFLALAALIRSLHGRYREDPSESIFRQIENLRYRVMLVRWMQFCGVFSIFGCVLAMFLIFEKFMRIAEWVFGGSLLMLMVSLIFSLREIQLSVNALNYELSDLEELRAGKTTAGSES